MAATMLTTETTAKAHAVFALNAVIFVRQTQELNLM